MSRPRRKSTIIPVKQIWQFQKPNDSCQAIDVEHDILEGWKITGYKDSFIFKGYFNPEDMVNAKAVVNLLTDAVAFIDKNIKNG